MAREPLYYPETREVLYPLLPNNDAWPSMSSAECTPNCWYCVGVIATTISLVIATTISQIQDTNAMLALVGHTQNIWTITVYTPRFSSK